jgi:hypothetical protein
MDGKIGKSHYSMVRIVSVMDESVRKNANKMCSLTAKFFLLKNARRKEYKSESSTVQCPKYLRKDKLKTVQRTSS